MTAEGPTLESLTHRLGDIPQEFLAEPLIGRSGTVHVDAVVHDLLQSLGFAARPADLAQFAGRDPANDRNRLAVTLIFAWLLADDWFRQATLRQESIMELLKADSALFGAQIASGKIIANGERREEIVRLTLARLGYRPAGETEAQAQDRLTSISSTERMRVVQAARAAEQRARAIREALARKAAEESADKFTRE